MPFVDLQVQHQSLSLQIRQATTAVLRRTNFILGDDVERFEGEFAAYCQTEHAVGVDSGTSALELALRAFEIGPDDEVITAANTFMATALAISHVGATPVLVDADPCTYTIDVQAIEAAITRRTRAIIPVHLYGHPADMDPIFEIAERHDLVVVEDACQAHGARYKRSRTGSLGNAAAFSFYPAKNLGACGDGGMVVTGDARLAATVRLLRNYGQREKNRHLIRGYNRRLDTLQAAILRVKLPQLEAWNERRREAARVYGALLGDSGVVPPAEAAWAQSVYHLYVVRAEDRDGLRCALEEQGIGTGIHYPTPIHLQPAYADLGYGEGSFPVSEAYARRILSLPMYPELGAEAVTRVAAAVARYCEAAVAASPAL
ncbi:MAG: DegT/DnrJ/EryC1/StrS family aminotransferase [Candidatus Latescibacterota bacterium]